jgi:ABC-type branched-subunit amino acid transport system ATPase component
MRSSALEVRDLVVRYGAVEAVRGVSFAVGTDEIVALAGPNGAGKSSILNAVFGALPAGSRSSGAISPGPDAGARQAHRIARLGIALAPEGRMLAGSLSVRDNLLSGGYALRGDAAARLADVLAGFPALADRLDLPAATLSGGEAQLLAIARGLMARPRLLLLDEPTLGLSPKARHAIAAALRAAQVAGTAVLLAEQSEQVAAGLADRVIRLVGGRLV